MTVDELQCNIRSVTERVRAASEQSGRDVTIVAAVKTVPIELINAAIDCGITDIGENRVQEFIAKNSAVKSARRHFIGTLQRNKAKYLVGNVGLIQSVDGMALAEEIDRLAAKRGIVQQALIEVNAADEPNKSGVSIELADELIAAVGELQHVEVRGIMSVPPKSASDGVYKALYSLFDKHRGGAFDILSVGMSNDFERAIYFGSNMVRIGTAIFGKRQQTK